jgi:aspartyl-tRNA(Asn)/glutamyl-tRNA(Gln) amidotransferase subunit A
MLGTCDNLAMSWAIDQILDAGVAALPSLYAGSALSPVDAVSAYLMRAETLNPELNAFLFLDAEGARAQAERSAGRWRAAAPLSVLDGVPVGIKANIAVEGWPWHAGIAAYRDRLAPADAACVGRLRAAGAILLGGLNMDEAALGATTDNLAFGRCRNPRDLGRTPGGSSGGSAVAVAAGLCATALGTDTMGSVRIPASYCGVFGHKPRLGAVSTSGVTPLSWTLDTVGVLARSAQDVDAAMAVLDPAWSRAAFGVDRLEGVRLGLLDLSDQVTIEDVVADAFHATMEAARAGGARVETIRLEGYDVVALRRAALLVAEVEGFVEHDAMMSAYPDGFTPGLKAMLAWGARQPAPKLASAYRRLAEMGQRIREAAVSHDAVLTPTTPQVAFPFDATVPANQADFTLPGNLAGLPATAFPVGSSPTGLPLSVQIMAQSEATALRLAATLARPLFTAAP